MKLQRSLCVSFLLAAGATGALAQSSAASAEKPVFAVNGDFRFRYEAYDSAYTLNSDAAGHHRGYFRVRLRLWETVNLAPDFSLFGRISAEPRNWLQAPASAAPTYGPEWKYAIVDNLYAKWTADAAGNPLTIIAGRQDIQLGEQWLVSDGTPLDGSWTNHFDGLRATLDAKSIKTKFDVIAFDQQACPGDRLPVFGLNRDAANKKYLLQEQDETGLVVYASNKSVKNLQLDGYFMYKGDDAVSSTISTKGYNADVYTLGARIAGTPAEHWQYSAEGAYQWGRRNDASGRFSAANNLAATGDRSRDVSAYAGIAKVTYLFKDSLNNQLTFCTEYISGDKEGTGSKDEMFDILWGRTPRISEVWAVAMGQETGRNAQYSNLFRLGASWSIAPSKKTSISATYNALFAPNYVPTRNRTSALFTHDSAFRGHEFQVVLKQKFTKQLSGLLLAEYCPMGDFYTNTDAMTFLRAEMLFTF
ncbi:MAG TPA: alginate export family protein [Opitutaceae bacterium]|nr:alginate export family protein [Opitutaceae bacterium]